MRTTIELPDDLYLAAKKRAAETGTTLRAIFERSLRRELAELSPSTKRERRVRIRWVTSPGGLPPALDLSDRAAMRDWLRKQDLPPGR
jgi:hypothetical protein